jgi:two-component system sensor histidine kinase/response regulator
MPLSRVAASTPRPVELAAVDLSVLSALVGSDPEVIREMLLSFRASASRSRDAIRIGVATGACKAVADAAHPLKSAARSIGALRLGTVCAEMEVAGENGQARELAMQLVMFEEEYADVARCLEGA